MTGYEPQSFTPVSDNPAEALEALQTGSSSRDVLDAVARMIEVANLGIGDRLPPEVEIARKLGISRAKVREALTAWQNMGIVTRNKKAGTTLATEVSSNAIHMPLTVKLEAESLLRTHAVRRPLEIEAVRLATRNATSEQREIVRRCLADLMRAFEADRRFHRTMQDASGNPLFGQLIKQIQQGFNEIYSAPFGQAHLGQDTIPLHPALARAFSDGNETEAMKIMGNIMDMVEAEIRTVMETLDA